MKTNLFLTGIGFHYIIRWFLLQVWLHCYPFHDDFFTSCTCSFGCFSVYDSSFLNQILIQITLCLICHVIYLSMCIISAVIWVLNQQLLQTISIIFTFCLVAAVTRWLSWIIFISSICSKELLPFKHSWHDIRLLSYTCNSFSHTIGVSFNFTRNLRLNCCFSYYYLDVMLW